MTQYPEEKDLHLGDRNFRARIHRNWATERIQRSSAKQHQLQLRHAV